MHRRRSGRRWRFRFDARTISGEDIRIDTEYGGIRLRVQGLLGKAKVSLQVDIGFGDVVTPAATELLYPSLLGLESPRLLAYTPETSVAEKLHAMVVLDMANTRLKDFLDIWTLAQGRAFASAILTQAIHATFERRKTPLPISTPIALTPTFYESATKQTQWNAYLRKARVSGAPAQLGVVAIKIRELLGPLLDAPSSERAFEKQWPPGGPWAA